MKRKINVIVAGRVAAAEQVEYICNNSGEDGYTLSFDFDEEWSKYEHKTARFIWNGKYLDVPFSGKECPVPKITNTYSFKVGVYAGDLCTTTSAYIPAQKSILCGNPPPADPEPDVYHQIMEKLNGTASAGEFKTLWDDVYGVHPKDTMLFDSKTDEFETGMIMANGTVSTAGSYVDRFYIPMVDVTHGSARVRINSFSTKNASDRGYTVPTSGHTVWIAQYDADKKFIPGTRENIGRLLFPIGGSTNISMQDLTWIETNNNGFGVGAEASITPVEGAAYVAIFNFFKGVDIDIEVFVDGADVEGVEPKDGFVDDIEHIRENIGDLREDMEQLVPKYRPEVDNAPLITTVFGKTAGSDYVTDFSAIAIADLHGSLTSLDDAATIRDTCVPNAVILNAGDVINLKAKMSGAINPEVAAYMEKAIQHCVYHTMGQHEVGWNSSSMAGGRLKENCMTHEEVFQYFIEPMKSVWDLPDLSTNYYYKDFATQKMRLISLYQYNAPLVEDETDSTCYKYDRNTLWLGQEQLDWLVNTLNTVPDGYKVIILQHQHEKDLQPVEGSAFYDGKTASFYGTYITGDKPVIDIVQAYINRGTLSKTYTAARADIYPSDIFTVTVNADFANAKGEFANHLSGDAHVDFVSTVKGTNQRHIVLTASNQSYDCYVDPKADGAYRSIVSLLGYDYKNSFIRLGRVGQQYSLAGQTRVFEKVTL